jgi:hypothetical protein
MKLADQKRDYLNITKRDIVMLLDVPAGTYRGWKEALSSLPDEDKFWKRDLLALNALNLFSEVKGIRKSRLAQYDWESVFLRCREASIPVLLRCRLFMDTENKTLTILPDEVKFNIDDKYLVWLHLRDVYKDMMDRFMDESKSKVRIAKDFGVVLQNTQKCPRFVHDENDDPEVGWLGYKIDNRLV